MKYRSRTDIASQMLEAANGGTTKTKIMYKAFLSYSQLREYLSMLTDNGLLEYDKSTETFKTTEKGTRFLRICNEMGKYASPETATTETKGKMQSRQ
nr:winged helix-turn-helix domain-containing protein [Candidatus Nitrososphaera gargensis]